MGDGNNHERELRERIAKFMQAHIHPGHEQTSEDDARTLRFAAGNLDRLLADIREYDRGQQAREDDLQVLRAAAGKLDRLLLQSAETAVGDLKLRRKKQSTSD